MPVLTEASTTKQELKVISSGFGSADCNTDKS